MTDVAAEPPIPDPVADPIAAVQEYFDSAGQTLASDASRGVLQGVKLLGLRSRNGRRYAEPALRQAIGLYEGSRVNVNHPARDPLAPRDYRDRLGVVRNVRMEPGSGLFGDLHYNPKHALAEQLAWDAEHAPENVGLSHNVLARTRRDGEGVVVEAITRVQSVDLVADPATTAGLFEQCEAGSTESPEAESLSKENASLREQVERLEQQLERHQRRARIDRLIAKQGLDEGAASALLSEAFVRQLMAADEADLSALVEDRVRLVRRLADRPQPRCREQSLLTGAEPTPNAAAFVTAVTGRR